MLKQLLFGLLIFIKPKFQKTDILTISRNKASEINLNYHHITSKKRIILPSFAVSSNFKPELYRQIKIIIRHL